MPPPPTKRPTLRTISEISGLAVPTVSRALNDAPDIGAKTKARVREIAAEIGYIPNRAGVRLRTGKTNVISLVLSSDHEVTDHTGRLISSIARSLHNTRYHLIVTPYFPTEDPMKPVRYIAETRSADAMILNQTEPQDSRVEYLMQREFPFVTYGRTDWCRDHPYFDFDNAAFGELAARRLAQRGRRHVMMVAPPLGQAYAQHMINGARKTFQSTGVAFQILEGASSDDAGPQIRRQVAQALTANPTIDGLICASTAATISSVAALEHVGRSVGTDIDVFAKEAIPFLKFFRDELLVVSEDVTAAGEFLAAAVIRAIERSDLPPMQGVDVARAPKSGRSDF